MTNTHEILNSILENKINSFKSHNDLINKTYGEIEDFCYFQLDEHLLVKLRDYLKKTSLTCLASSNKIGNDYLILSDYKNSNKIKEIDDNLIHFKLTKCKVIEELHNFIRNKVKNYIKSPFSFVNTRAWVTKPNTTSVGPNKPHKDGFPPGHLKVMIYITPLSKDYGRFWIEKKILSDQKPGFCFVFKNSDFLHSGLPGHKFNRICLEVTIFRSFVNSSQFHNGHPNGRHYSDIKKPYQNISALPKNL